MEQIIEETLKVLNRGGIILYPTDTVWGIGCDGTKPEAVRKIYALKRRIDTKAMIMLVGKVDDLWRYVEDVPPIAEELFEASSGGGKPVTVILPGGCGVADNVLPEEGTIALRVPGHDFCQRLLRKFKRPLVSTSANISGEKSPNNFGEISAEILSGVDYIVPREMEKGAKGSPSSIIMVGGDSSVTIIRQ
ncbi:MAG: L-threonylcarbamoyladenylate synthase [Rikenellaceae bacterium]